MCMTQGQGSGGLNRLFIGGLSLNCEVILIVNGKCIMFLGNNVGLGRSGLISEVVIFVRLSLSDEALL